MKITNIAGLKKEIKSIIWPGVGTGKDILKLIGLFETSVKERIQELEGEKFASSIDFVHRNEYLQKELRRMLGKKGNKHG